MRSLALPFDEHLQHGFQGDPELSSSKLIVLGFSGTGALFAHFVAYAPDHVLAAILTNSGQTDPYGMDRIDLSPKATAVPQLIIVGGADEIGGTQRNFEYFEKYRKRGAPWVFLVQNGIPHCCVINKKTANKKVSARERSWRSGK